jgi:hypothetical protein
MTARFRALLVTCIFPAVCLGDDLFCLPMPAYSHGVEGQEEACVGRLNLHPPLP